jgi:peroxiredoxin
VARLEHERPHADARRTPPELDRRRWEVVRTLYGRTYMGNERTTFVIDAEGKISHIFRKVKPAEHDDKVLAALTG